MTTLKQGSKSFYFASLFLPSSLKTSLTELYFLCRYADDLVDNPPFSDSKKIKQTLIDFKNSDRVKSFLQTNNIPFAYFEHLIEGVTTDLYKNNYNNFDELYEYCYKVAGVVGIMICYLINFTNKKYLQAAEHIGVAMQITNILRDINQDALLGRLYLPQSDIKKFSVTVNTNLTFSNDANFKNLLKNYINVANDFYDKGTVVLYTLPFKYKFGLILATNIYKDILYQIEKNNYNVLEKRIYVSTARKILILFSTLYHIIRYTK